MSGAMALWAVVSTLTAICHDFKGLVLTRFFLGVTEAPFYPGALYVLSIFYTKKEIATRISILFTANICGTAFAGLIAIGVFEMSGVAGLAGWRWLFILQGIITFVISLASAFVLPDEPSNTRWLTEEERILAHERIAADTVQIRTNTTTFAGLIDACKDPRLWVLVFMQHFHMAASNFKNFFPTIVGTLGFDRNTTLALTCPPYIVSGIVCIAWAANSGKLPATKLLERHLTSNRPDERKNLAYYPCESHGCVWFHLGLYRSQYWRPIFRNVRLCQRCLRL
jgi:MFS family permease